MSYTGADCRHPRGSPLVAGHGGTMLHRLRLSAVLRLQFGKDDVRAQARENIVRIPISDAEGTVTGRLELRTMSSSSVLICTSIDVSRSHSIEDPPLVAIASATAAPAHRRAPVCFPHCYWRRAASRRPSDRQARHCAHRGNKRARTAPRVYGGCSWERACGIPCPCARRSHATGRRPEAI
jgi:hypothetical protein